MGLWLPVRRGSCSRLFLALEAPPGGGSGGDKFDAGAAAAAAAATATAEAYALTAACTEARAPHT